MFMWARDTQFDLFEHIVFFERRQPNHDRDAETVKRDEAIRTGMKGERCRRDHVGSLEPGRLDPVAEKQRAGGDTSDARGCGKLWLNSGHVP
jgi:hypothetical protein